MTLPAQARIEATPTFVRDVRTAQAFLVEQDASAAPARDQALLLQLKEARGHLAWNPSAGRPARFLESRSAQGRTLAAHAKALAAQHGVPQLRELVVKPYVLLYAHSAERVVLLALKHERQLSFSLDEPA